MAGFLSDELAADLAMYAAMQSTHIEPVQTRGHNHCMRRYSPEQAHALGTYSAGSTHFCRFF
jgi:uncharacterized protein Smg (DUF494 family)